MPQINCLKNEISRSNRTALRSQNNNLKRLKTHLHDCCDLVGEIVTFGKFYGMELRLCFVCVNSLTMTGAVTFRLGGKEEVVAELKLQEGDPPKATFVGEDGTPGNKRNVRTFSYKKVTLHSQTKGSLQPLPVHVRISPP